MNDETRKVLATAKGIVAQGWCQHELYDDHGNHCVMGALYEAEESYSATRAFCEALDALCVAASVTIAQEEGGKHPIAVWNDAPERTQVEVVALFDEVLTESVVRERESVTA